MSLYSDYLYPHDFYFIHIGKTGGGYVRDVFKKGR